MRHFFSKRNLGSLLRLTIGYDFYACVLLYFNLELLIDTLFRTDDRPKYQVEPTELNEL